MGKRIDLHEILCEMLGSTNVYFQPPENLKLKFPCIKYNLAKIDTRKADDISYNIYKRYDVTYVSSDPDNDFCEKVLGLKYTAFDRRYVYDGMYHDTYTVYY